MWYHFSSFLKKSLKSNLFGKIKLIIATKQFLLLFILLRLMLIPPFFLQQQQKNINHIKMCNFLINKFKVEN